MVKKYKKVVIYVEPYYVFLEHLKLSFSCLKMFKYHLSYFFHKNAMILIEIKNTEKLETKRNWDMKIKYL